MQRGRNGRTSETTGADGKGIRNPRARQRAFCIVAGPDEPDLSELRELLRTAGVAVAGEAEPAARRARPRPLPRARQARGGQAGDQGGRREPRRLRRRAAAAPGAQPRAGARRAGDRPHGDHPRHLRRPRATRPRARCRSSWPSSSTTSRACAGSGPTSSGSAPGIGTRGPGESQIETDRRLARDRIAALKRRLRAHQGHARRRCAASASARRCRPSRSPATRTPASRRC